MQHQHRTDGEAYATGTAITMLLTRHTWHNTFTDAHSRHKQVSALQTNAMADKGNSHMTNNNGHDYMITPSTGQHSGMGVRWRAPAKVNRGMFVGTVTYLPRHRGMQRVVFRWCCRMVGCVTGWAVADQWIGRWRIVV